MNKKNRTFPNKKNLTKDGTVDRERISNAKPDNDTSNNTSDNDTAQSSDQEHEPNNATDYATARAPDGDCEANVTEDNARPNNDTAECISHKGWNQTKSCRESGEQKNEKRELNTESFELRLQEIVGASTELTNEINAVDEVDRQQEQPNRIADLGNQTADKGNLESGKRKKRRNKILGYTGFILLNVLIVAILVLVEDKSGDTAAGWQAISLVGKNLHFTILAFAMFFAVVAFDSMVFYVLVKKSDGKAQFGLSVKVSLLGRYYDRITPWSMGGEPFQIGFLMKGGLSGSNACAVTMSRHIVRFFTTAVVVIVILASSGIATTVWVMVAAIISVMGGLVLPTFMLICSFNPKLGHRIGKGIVTLLFKMKLVKDHDKQMVKMQENIDKFLSGIKYLSLNKTVIVLIGISALVELFALNSVPFLVMRALGIYDITYWKTLVLCIFVTYSASFAPTPGGAGIAELSFYAIFAAHIVDGYLFWAVLFWRIAVFYVPVFVGFFIQVGDGVASILKIEHKRLKG